MTMRGATAASFAANAALLRQMPFNTRTTARCASYVPNELPPLTRLGATAEAVPPIRDCESCIVHFAFSFGGRVLRNVD